jgi:hypothetical protein
MTSTQTSTTVRPETGTYVIDPGRLTFTGRHMMIPARCGRFRCPAARPVADDPNQSSVEATINVQSLESGGDVKATSTCARPTSSTPSSSDDHLHVDQGRGPRMELHARR